MRATQRGQVRQASQGGWVLAGAVFSLMEGDAAHMPEEVGCFFQIGAGVDSLLALRCLMASHLLTFICTSMPTVLGQTICATVKNGHICNIVAS